MIKRMFSVVLMIQWMPVQASEPVAFAQLVENKDGMAPALGLSDIDSQSMVFNDFENKVTLVHFWATWCTPCLKELPDLKSFSEKYSNREVRVITVAADSHELVKEFVTKRSVGLDIMVDQYGSAMRDYKVKALPTSYIIDKNGELRFSAMGPIDWLSNETGQLVEKLLVENIVAMP